MTAALETAVAKLCAEVQGLKRYLATERADANARVADIEERLARIERGRSSA